MKKICFKYNRLLCGLGLVALISITSTPAYSAIAQVSVIDIESAGLAKLGKLLSNTANIINHGISVANNNIVRMVNDLVFTLDPLMPLIMTDNQKVAAADKNTGTNVNNYLDQSINTFLSWSADSDAEDFDTNPPIAGDDVPLGQGSSSVLSSIFSSGSKGNSVDSFAKGNSIFNLYKILTSPTIADNDIKNFDSALRYIDPVSGLNIVRIGTSFKIAFSPSGSAAGTLIKTDEKNKDKSFESLKLYLSKQEEYQKYKHSYRSILAQRIWYLSNIIETFERRIPATKGGKSLAQLEDEQIDRYQQDAYYREIAKAPLGTLLRENIIVNTKILAEIHKLRLDLEKAKVLAAVGNLQGLGLTSTYLSTQADRVEKHIYHWAHPEDKSVQLGGSGTGTVTEQLQQSGLTPQSK